MDDNGSPTDENFSGFNEVQQQTPGQEHMQAGQLNEVWQQIASDQEQMGPEYEQMAPEREQLSLEEINKGRTIVQVVLALIGALQVGSFLIGNSNIILVAIWVAWIAAIWKGINWVRCLFGVLQIIGGVLGFIWALLVISVYPAQAMYLVVIGVLSAALGILFLVNKNVKAFLRSQRLKW